ncbi:hypothetical protein M9458_051008 [Cirrhinus mrigala]|uniref:Uncharacterized protein n=1 Tax=Cirrhinus mrigala TaxID=683832 RepID=A0ABD0MWM0_CIRMR
MADQGAQEAMVEQTVRKGMAGQGVQEAMTDACAEDERGALEDLGKCRRKRGNMLIGYPCGGYWLVVSGSNHMLLDGRRIRILHSNKQLGITSLIKDIINKIHYGSAAIVRSQNSAQIIIF